MQKEYVKPKMNIVSLDSCDVIMTSGEALIVDMQSDGLFEFEEVFKS